MTEQELDALRVHAEKLADEVQRFQRSLRGSNANREQAIEHLTNVVACADRCWAHGLRPVVDEPPVVEIAIAPPAPEKRGWAVKRKGR